MNAKIVALKQQYEDIVAILDSNERLDLRIAVNEGYAKTLLVSAASYFEFEIIEILRNYLSHHANNNTRIDAFVWKMTLDRKFYTLFNFKANNVNGFFSLFGDEMKGYWDSFSKEKGLSEATKTFLQICEGRNKIVHGNYIDYQLEDTFDRLYERYVVACNFLDALNVIFACD